MSEDQLKAFLEAIKGDAALQERLKAAEDLDAVVAIAMEAGFTIGKAEVLKAQAMSQQTLELSEQELEAVAGGMAPKNQTQGGMGVICSCFCKLLPPTI